MINTDNDPIPLRAVPRPTDNHGDPRPGASQQSPEDDARARAQACYAEIAQVLQKHRCIIQAVIQEPEPVGRDGSRVQLQAAYGVIPQV